MSSDSTKGGWGEGLTVGGKTLDTEQDTSSQEKETTTTGSSGWGSGLTVGGKAVDDLAYDDNSLVGTASVGITITTSYSRTLRGETCESVDDGKPLTVVDLGSTFVSDNYSPSCWFSYGVDIRNPNFNLLAYNVQLETTVKDKGGNIVDILTDYISFIDPGATFHFGNERYLDTSQVGAVSVSAYANQYYRVTHGFSKICSFGDVSTRRSSYGSIDLFGQVQNTDSMGVDWCTGYVQFLGANGEIKGGANGAIGTIPAHQSRPLKISLSVDTGAPKYVTSVDFDL